MGYICTKVLDVYFLTTSARKGKALGSEHSLGKLYQKFKIKNIYILCKTS